MRTRLMLASALLACVALSGCGAVESQSHSANTTKLAFKYHGATGSVLIPVPRTDPRLAEIEGYRKRAKAKPVCYAIVKVDNTRGTRELFMASLLTDAPLAEYDGANYWVTLWEKNRGGGNKELDGDEPVVTLLDPYDTIQYAPGMEGTTVFAVEYVNTQAGPRRCDEQREPSSVRVYLGPDEFPSVEATKVPTSATP